MNSTQHRAPASRCVFVGNIPYDATEEQLVHICEEVGPVVSFRLVSDRETGKPKGYGFCEFRDEETALSARRNLQGYEINGRQLRVDFAENEKGGGDRSRDQGRGGPGLPTSGFTADTQRHVVAGQTAGGTEPQEGGHPVMGHSVGAAAASFMTGSLGDSQYQYGATMNGHSVPVANGSPGGAGGNEALTSSLAGMSNHQMYEVMVQMKTMIQQNPQQVRQLLIGNPQVAKALFQAQIMLGMVRAPNMNQLDISSQGSQPQSQVGPSPATNSMLHPPLPPHPRPVAMPPAGILGQVQQTSSQQTIGFHPPAQQQQLHQQTFQQGGLVQTSPMGMTYPQHGLPPGQLPPQQQQYQMMASNVARMGSDLGAGAPSMSQNSLPGNTGGAVGMGPGGTAHLGRGPSMPQAGGHMSGIVPGLPLNQVSQPSSGPMGGIPGGAMHGMVPMATMGNGHPMGAPAPMPGGLPGMGAPTLIADNNPRPSYMGLSGVGHPGPLDRGLGATGSSPQPQGYGQVAHQVLLPQQQPQVLGELEQQKALLQQVLSLTADQINSLPPDQRQQVLQLQQALRT